MDYLKPRFSVQMGGKDYRSGWDRIFGRKPVCEVCGVEDGAIRGHRVVVVTNGRCEACKGIEVVSHD